MLISKLREVLRNPLMLAFYLPGLMLSVSDGMLVPVLPIYAKELEASYGLVGLVLAGEGLGMLLGDVPAGVLMRRFGQKGSIVIGTVGVVIATVSLFFPQPILMVVFWRVVSGLGRALWSVARHAYIAEAVGLASRGRAIALLGGTMRIGRFFGPVVGGIVAAQYGLRSAFLGYGVLGVLSAVAVIAFTHPDRRVAGHAPTGSAGYLGHLLAVIKAHYRVLLSAGLGQILAQAIRAGRGVIIPLYASDVIGLDVDAIGYIVSISSAIDMVLFYPAGVIMDRIGRKMAIVPSFLLQGIGMLLVPLTSSFAALAFAATLIGFGNGLGSGSMMTVGADLAPRDRRGEFLGVWRLIGDVGASGGPLAVGGVADLVTLPMAAWVMCGVGLAATVVFAALVPETLRKRHRAVSAAP
jgi:MFS family permease